MSWLLLWVIRCEDGDQSLNADISVNTVNLSTYGWILANLIVLGASGSSSTRISLGLCFLKGCSVWWLIPTVNSRELRYTWAWIAHIFGYVWRPLQRGLIEEIRCTLVASDNFLWVGILGQIKRIGIFFWFLMGWEVESRPCAAIGMNAAAPPCRDGFHPL